MKRSAFCFACALLGMLLAACSSTAPRALDAARPTETPAGAARSGAAAAQKSSAPASIATPSAQGGPVTPSMAQLQLGGERYATMGDPNAPLTMIEFSDFG